MIPKTEIRLHKKSGEQQWNSSYSTFFLTNMQLSEGLEVNRDMFRLSLDNQKNTWINTFDIDDRVVIYVYTGTSPTIDDLLFDGLIIELDFDLTEQGRNIIIRGANRTHELLSNLVLVASVDNSKNVSEIIEEIINQVNNNNQATESTDIRRLKFDSTTLAQTKADGSSFADKTFIVNYKPAYEAIRQFSEDEYTEDGSYIYWIDSENYFHWKSKKIVTYAGLNLVEGQNIERISIRKGTWDVYNSLIIDVGKDCHNNGNHVLHINTVSILETGAKWKFLDKSAISPTLINEQFNKGSSLFPKDSDGSRTSNFPSSYPFTLSFKEIINGVQQTNSWVVSNNASYNAAIRQEARRKGREEGINYLRRYGDVKYKGTVTLNGTLDFEKGMVVNITSPSVGLSAYPLRIMDLSHSFGTSGWQTELSLEEDEE